MSAEDLFTNSLGITGTLALLHEQPALARRIEESLAAIHGSNPDISPQEERELIGSVLSKLKPWIADKVVRRTAQDFGIRPATVETSQLPSGLYPLVSTKLTAADGATPTVIDLRAAGIQPNNPNVHFRAVHVPAVQNTAEHALGKFGL
jgi:hypothetical protein